VSLLIALAAGAAGAFVFLYCLSSLARSRRPCTWISRLALLCGLAALISGAASAGVHFAAGHGPGAAEPMQGIQFFRFHKAYLLVLILAAFSLLGGLVSTARFQSPDRPHG